MNAPEDTEKGKVWVLDTDTKGTGAQMVPLESAHTGLPARPERTRAPGKAPSQPRSAEAPEARKPRTFKVVDALSRQVLVEDTGARETLDALAEVRSVVDVSIYVWQPSAATWRPLTIAERKTLFRLRDRRSQ